MNAPQQIGGFVLERELGRGGMGVVYLARDPRVGRPVALKVILGDPSPDVLRRFQAEARAAGQLDHPNVVRVLSAGEDQGRPFLALEFVEGEALSERLKRSGTLDPEPAAKLIGELARGVAHAHERGVIHRDIKPDNVLLVGETPRLTDFGLARLGERQHTQTGAVMGTPAYMAPEQAAGEAARVGPHSDVYGLGALLYRCLAGRPPFVASSAITILRKVINEPPEPLPEIPAPLRTVLEQGLDKVPERRPSAAQLAWQLEGWVHEASAPAGGVAPRRSPAAAGTSPRWPLVVSACSLLVAAGVAGWVLLRGESEPAPVEPPPPVVDGSSAGPDAEAVRELVRRVAAAREEYRWDEADALLAEAPRDASDALPPALAFEAAYLQLRRCRYDAALRLLDPLAQRCDGALLGRVQALRALATARELRWDESAIAEEVALAEARDDWLVQRLLALTAFERLHNKPEPGAKSLAVQRLAQAIETGDPSPDTRALLANQRAVEISDLVARRELLRAQLRDYPCAQALTALAANLGYVPPPLAPGEDAMQRRVEQWDEALECVERALALAPEDPKIVLFTGGLYVGRLQCFRSVQPEHLARAEELLERGLALAPEDPHVVTGFSYSWRILGECHLQNGDREQGVAHLERARGVLREGLKRYPGAYRLLLELVECLENLEGPDAALHALAPLLRTHPEQPVLHYQRYVFLMSLKRYDEALAEITEAARLDPQSLDYARIRDSLRRQLGK